MKAPWFPLYTGDFLASPDVQLMGAHEVGAYVLLLMNSWQSDTPGYLAADEGRLRRICRFTPEQWADSREILLGKWPLAENGLLHNPRLLREADVQLARRERLAANGQKGGRPPQKQKQTNDEAKNNLQVSEDNQKVLPEEPTGLLSQPQSQSTKVDREDAVTPAPTPTSLTHEKGGQRLRDHGDTPLFDPATWPALADPQKFANVCAQLGYPQVDFEIYRRQILAKLEGEQMPAKSLRNYIEKYLNNHNRDKQLILAQVQVPNEIPSNYHGQGPYVPQPGNRIPDMSSIMNTNWKPTG